MLGAVARKFFGSRNDRLVKKYMKTVEQINAMESTIASLDDASLQAKTDEFRQRLKEGATLDDLLVEAFAVIREASKRVLGLRHYDVQHVGGLVLHGGKIAEMKTGEGKTLVGTLAVYLNALEGKGVHVITVNDYLAQRDASTLAKLYSFMGMSTGVIVSGIGPAARKEAYARDITYGTNNEFGFDYLRDNMAFQVEDRVQRGLNFAIVDEVDSILIDEARTPLIISGPTQDSTELYNLLAALVPELKQQQPIEGDEEEEFGPGDFNVDEKSKQVHLSEEGMENIENMLHKADILEEGTSLYDTNNIIVLHHMLASLRAHALFKPNVDYIVDNGEIVIVDEFTGRTMRGRRWSDGLHQAIEAKEGVPVQAENQTLASITFQNFFRMYTKLSGMTGTADTEAFELNEIYGLEVVVIPTHRPMIRDDGNDLVYMTEEEKYAAISKEIQHCQEKGQPVLVGTASIETSEIISHLLTQNKVKHEVLNAKQHEREASIIENAGRSGSITIATNMAGRGTDIVLGGSLEAEITALGDNPDPNKVKALTEAWQKRHDEVLAAGGLHIIGSERHESRRIDNQLRGRAGRQGDPGSSRFFLSMEDNLMRIFASEKVKNLMLKFGMEKGQAIEAGMVSRSIENAQRKVEAHNFDIRKHLLDYDDVANDQRKVVYEQRSELLETDDISETVEAFRVDVVDELISLYVPKGSIDEQWNIKGLTQALKDELGLEMDIQAMLDADDELYEVPLREQIQQASIAELAHKEEIIGSENMRALERNVMLNILDSQWKEHLAMMDMLRQGVGLRSYAQKNPAQEYKREGFDMFSQMLGQIKQDVVGFLMRVEVTHPEELDQFAEHPEQEMEFQHAEAELELKPQHVEKFEAEKPPAPVETFQRTDRKVGRNEPCPCGSGKKYKQCCGRLV